MQRCNGVNVYADKGCGLSQPDISIRDYRESDIPFILSTWMRNYRDMGQGIRDIPSKIYYTGQKQVILDALERGHALCAVDPGDPDQIFGYIAFGTDNPDYAEIHYCYLKSFCRRHGIAKKLFLAMAEVYGYDPEAPFVITHTTPNIKKRVPAALYNPYILRSLHVSR